MIFNGLQARVGMARRSFLLLSVAPLALTPPAALADCTTVTGNETAGCILSAPAQSLTIQTGGVLNGWIRMTGVGASLNVNSGGMFRYDTSVGTNSNVGLAMQAPNQVVTNNGTLAITNNVFADLLGANATGFRIVNGATGVIASNNSSPFSNAITTFVGGVSGTLVNFGRVSATGGGNEGTIFMPGAGGLFTLDNRLGATIRGDTAVAVNVASNKITNLRNAGTISTGIVGGTAISLGSNNDTLTLEPTSSIIGIVNAGGGVDTFTLGGSTTGASFDIGQIGAAAQYRNFENFQKVEAGTWTLIGAGGVATNWTVSGGTLRLGSSSLGLASITAAGGDVAYANAVVIGTPVILNLPTQLIVDGTDSATQAGIVSGSGTMTKNGAGTLVLSGANTYTGGTVISGGTLQLGNGGTTGSLLGDVTNNAALVFNRSDAQSFTGVVSGAGSVTQAGTGTTIFTAANSYTGGTTIAGGTLQLGNGGTTGSLLGDVANNAALVFNRSDTLTISGAISGTGTVDQNGSGNTILTGLNAYTGTTTVNAGGLFINGNQIAASGSTNVNAGATLGGTGTIGGNVNVASGATLAPGDVGAAPGTLTINQNLALNSSSTLEYSFGQANVVAGAFNDLTTVSGDLVLDGTLDVVTAPGGSFDTGIYRVISYDGSLTNNGLDVGTVPTPNFLAQTSVANQVNLINTNGLTLNFWDGNAGPKNDSAVNGGDGVWQNIAGNDNWTDETGAVNAPFADASFAIFMATPGTVTVDNSLGAVRTSGMQFASDGYVINGGPVTLVGAPSSTIRVGDGTAAGAGYTARIEAELTGDSQLVKTDLGTVVLTGTNSYSGGTAIRDGVIEIARDDNLGAAAGSLAFTNNGTLHTTVSIATSRAVDFTAGNGTFRTDATTTLTLTGVLTGAGNLIKAGQGTLLLTGSDSHSGTTTVSAGTLMAGEANVLSPASAHTVLGGATLDLDGHDQTIAALDSAGLVRFAALGTTLNIAGNFTGNGGTFELDTALGTDTSVTDFLRVGGNTSGSSTLKVSNAGGAGGQTVEGIKIVDVAGASNGAFSLAGDFVFQGEQAVIAGAYAYRLYKNGVSTPTDGDWYLRSQLTNPQVPGEPPQTPLFQPGVPLYESYAQILLGLNGLPTLRQRVGNRYWIGAGNGVIEQGDGPGVAEAAPMPSDGGGAYVDERALWTRIDAAHMRVEPKTSTSNAAYDYNVWNLQSGFDGKLYENDSGLLIGGITGRYGQSFSDISSIFGTGSIDTEGYGLGATLTWYGKNGFYIDGQAQVTWYDSDLFSDTTGRSLVDGNDGFGYALSVETGKRIAVDQNWTMTPQVQLVYSAVDYDTFSDPFNAQVALDSGDSLRGRLGISAEYQNAWADQRGRLQRTSLYGIANLYYEFLDGAQVDVSTINFASASDRLWGGIGAGGSYNWADDKYALFGEVSVNTSLASLGDSYSLNGTAGFRMKW